MAISAISGNITTAAVEQRERKQANRFAVNPPPKPGHDTVQLSATARAKSLELLGNAPVQIAQIMGTDIESVNGYLEGLVQTPVYLAVVAPKGALTPLPTAISLYA